MSVKKARNEPRSALIAPMRLGAVAVAACFLTLPALSNPVNPTVVNGSATFSQAGNVLTVTNSNGAIINWDKFSIGAGETTRFIQASASSSVLNRVLANDPSLIYGTLSSNGRVWLVNPAGIMVGAGGRVDVAGFVASTLNISNENFLAGRKLFDNTPGAGSVVNQGTITTPSGGSVYLIGSNVSNEGLITTPNGETILAAGQTVSLIDSATPGVKVDITGAEGNATNLGTITAEAGRIGIAGVIVRNSGVLNASSVVSDGGRIFLKASGDTLVEGGQIRATSAVGKGGEIDVLGDRVAVAGNTEIDASGATGGGYVRVGGDYQGSNPEVQNARITYFGQDAVIKVDATENGNGGTAIVWSDDTTRAYGRIYARGGTNGGNGGFVENSGHDYLDFQGRVDTSAPRGIVGKLLLDPSDIIIDNSTDNLAGGIFSGGWFSGATTNATLTWATINAQSGSLEIRTNSAGTGGNGDININASGSVTGPTSLTLLANRDINFGSGVTVSAGPANISLIAGWNNTGWAVNPGTGLVSLGTNAALTTTTGNLYIYSGNGLTVQSGATINVGGILDIGTLANPMYGNVLVNGNIQSSGSAQNIYAAGNVNVQATNLGFAGISYSGAGTQTIQGASILVAGENASGGSAHGAQISTSNAASTQTVTATAGGINIVGGGYMGLGTNNSASISAAGSQTVSATGILTLVGGGGADNNWAYLYSAGNQNVTAAGMALTAGIGGNRAGTYIRGDGDQHLVTTAGGITLTGATAGTFYGGYATIVHGPTGGNQLIDITGGGLTALGGGGTGLAYGANATPLIAGICAGDSSCIANGVSANYAGINNRTGTTTLNMHGGAILLQGGSGVGSTANQAYYSNGSTGTQTILNAGAITLTGGASGGNGYTTADGFHYLVNNAVIFSPLGAQDIHATSVALSSTATAAAGFAGVAIFGNGQTITTGGALSLAAGNTNAGGGAAVIRSIAGQTISAGAVTVTAGGGGYDNTASIDQLGTGAYSQSLTATSLTVHAGSGNGTGGNTGDCGPSCNGITAHNSAGVYNAGSLGQTVNVTGGPIALYGGTVGNRNNAYIQNRAGSLQTINAGSILLQGGDSGGVNTQWMFGLSNVWGGSWLSNTASITSGWSGGLIGAQNITSTGAITLNGNSGAGTGGMAGAGIAATGAQTISGAAISLTGGAGAASVMDSWARIVSLGTQTINGTTLDLHAGATGVGNRASITGYGQNINLSGNLLTVYGGGSTGNDFSNTAEIVNYGGSGQFITISPAAAIVTVHGGAGSGVNPLGSNECGALCNNLSSWNVAQIRNESGNQTLNLAGGGGSITITGGSVGNDNYANIENKTSGTQSILGSPNISVVRGASGGVVAWGQQQVASPDHPLGSWRWFEMTNDAGIQSDGTQIINAGAIALNSSVGTAYGGTFITGKTQNITATGAVTLTGGSESIASAITGPSSLPVLVLSGTASEFLFVAPAVIGDDQAGHSLNLSVGSLSLSGGGYGLYGGSPTLIGTYKNATNTSIISHGAVTFSPAANGSVQVGSFFGSGGSLSISNTAPGLSFDGAWVGTGATGTVALSAAGGSFSQVAGGKLWGHDVSISMGGGSVAQPTGAVIQATNLSASGNILSFAGDNLANNVTLASTGAGGVVAYNTASDVHVVSATSMSGNIALTANVGSSAYIGLGTVTAAGGNVSVTADKSILDDNGTNVINATGTNVTLVSRLGGLSGALAISADTAATTALSATVSGGTYGGIYVRNFTASSPTSITLTDAASSQKMAKLYQDSALSLAGASFNAGTGDIIVGSSGTMSGVQTSRFVGTPTKLVLTTDADMSLSGPLSLSTTDIGLGALGILTIGSAVTGKNVALAGGTLNVNASVTASVDLIAGAGTLNVNSTMSAQDVILAANTLNVGLSGGVTASNQATSDLFATVTGNATIDGGYLKTTGGDLQMIVGGNLTLMNGGHIYAGYMQSVAPFSDASIAVGGILSLDSSSYIRSANDIYLDMLGSGSKIVINNGSYVLSDIGTGVVGTTHVTFAARSSGGIFIDGVEDEKNSTVGGSGFFAVNSSTPSVDKLTGLEIVYPNAVNVDPCVLNPVLCQIKVVTDQSGPKVDDPKKDKEKDKDKDKDKFGEEGEGKKEEKPAQRRVAQCT